MCNVTWGKTNGVKKEKFTFSRAENFTPVPKENTKGCKKFARKIGKISVFPAKLASGIDPMHEQFGNLSQIFWTLIAFSCEPEREREQEKEKERERN